MGVAAAAALVLAWIALPEATPDAAAERGVLLARADTLRVSWTSTDPSVTVGGDVVWSPSEQRGYMRFEGLAPNDPTREQYQLWIFDAERDERYPVDGGVFDVGSSGEVIVPIRARLGVANATLFAISIERPGGVVVSSRERLPLIAKVGG